ncbi:MAG: undecaprenyl-diphosphate phosphatase [Candidatus Omnitrophota bacterium]
MLLQYIVLGIVQGLTEYLPISSSAHLVITQGFFNITGPEAVFLDITLHLGTLFAVLVFLFKDILKIANDKRILSFIAVSTFITALIGFSGQIIIERMFSSMKLVTACLFITGIILLATKNRVSGTRKESDIGIKDAALFGITQGLAIMPGISRSGITVSTLLFRNVDREAAFRLSFMASIPVIALAFLFKLKDAHQAADIGALGLIAGFVASFITGILALKILFYMLKQAKFHWFGYYCIAVALVLTFWVR